MKPKKNGTTEAEKKKTKILITVIIVAFIALAAIVAVGITKQNKDAEKANQKEDKKVQETWGDEYLGIDPQVDKELKDYSNFVIYGVDNNGKSDIINVFSVNNKTKEIRIEAINRDAYLECDEGRFHKANRGYTWGGIDQGLWELNHNLDLNCRTAIALDWMAVEKLVDAVGGVEVTIDSTLTLQHVNSGIKGYCSYANKEEDEASKHIINGIGTHNLDGIQAVAYCRVRKDADSFKRAERNEEVLAQMFAKAKTMSKSELTEVYDEISPYVQSNMSSNKMLDTIMTVMDGNIAQQYIWPAKYETWWDEFYYYVPITLESEVKDLHNKLFDQEDYEPSETVMKLDVEIKEDLQDGTLYIP